MRRIQRYECPSVVLSSHVLVDPVGTSGKKYKSGVKRRTGYKSLQWMVGIDLSFQDISPHARLGELGNSTQDSHLRAAR